MTDNTYVKTLCLPGGETLRLTGKLSATGEETEAMANMGCCYDGSRPNLKRSLEPDETNRKPGWSLQTENKKYLQVGTWNVRTMLRKGKLENVKREMNRMNIDVLGVSEVRWKGNGDFISDGMRVIYAGGEESQRGVAVILNCEAAKRVVKIVQHSDRLILVKLEAKPVNMVIVQVYMPTTDHEDDAVEHIYEEIEKLIGEEKGTDYLIVMGDWNAVLGEGREGNEVGSYGLGVRNDRGQLLLDFCKRKQLVATNTWFQQEKRRRYTWIKPGDTGRYQIDYILVRQRYRNSVKNCKTYPGADADTDHNLVMMKMAIKLKKLHKRQQKKRWALDALTTKQKEFRMAVEKEIQEQDKNKEQNVEEDWKDFKTAIIAGAEATIGYRKGKKAKKPWITDQMIEKMDERRKWKSVNTEAGKQKYKQLNNELRRETDKAREEWWSKQCEELEEMEKKGRTDLMYSKVKHITRTGKTNVRADISIKDAKGEMLTDSVNIRNRWKEYVEELYGKQDKPEMEEMGVEKETTVEEDSKGPALLQSEIRAAIKELKEGKAEGVDGIPAEFLKVLDGESYKQLEKVCMEIYNTGRWPEDFTQVIMIPMPKTAKATECADHRTISLISHAAKIVLRILTKRIEAKATGVIGKTQFGFRKGCGTRDAIGIMRMVCERSLELDNELCVCFVDFEKAFDRINWAKMMEVLKNIGVDWRDKRLIANLYMNQTASVRVADEMSEQCIIGRGVRQGCCMSPLLFSLYAEAMMVEALEEVEEGVKVNGRLVKDVRFADDQGMIASNEEGLQKLMDALVNTAAKYDMKVNVKKTKVMKISKKDNSKLKIIIDGQCVEQVKKFKYLGSLITEDGRCETEVKARIAMGKDAFSKRKELLTRKMNKTTKKKMIKTLVWSIVLYGAETWTLRKEEVNRLNAFEMWLWRRMEKISWTEKKSNEEVLQMVGEKRKLVEVIVQRKKRWIGHILRGDGLMKEVMEGKMEGKRARGRPRKGMVTELKEGSYGEMKRRAEDRGKWRCWMPKDLP
jgi:hypothetical protein